MQAMSVIQSRDGGVCIRGNFQATMPVVGRENSRVGFRIWHVAVERKGWEGSKARKNDKGRGEVRNHILVKF